MSTKREAVLVLDIGTSMLKTCLIDSEGAFIASKSKPWQCTPDFQVPGALHFSPERLLEDMMILARELISSCAQARVRGIIVSTQRLGYVLLDKNHNPLAGLPNIDRRAVQEAQEEKISDKEVNFCHIGRWAGPQHLRARIQWFLRHRPNIMKATKTISSIGGFIEGNLTGIWKWEATTACESAMLDIQSGEFCPQYEEIGPLFGEKAYPGECLGPLLPQMAHELGVADDVKVYAGAGDTQLGVLGAGGIHHGDVVVVAGSSAPVNAVVNTPIIDTDYRMITNFHVNQDQWVIEANAMMTGLTFQWTKNLLFDQAENGYALLNSLAADFLNHAKPLPEIQLHIGACLANARKGNTYPVGRVSLSMRDMNGQMITRGAVALASFESNVYAILGNIGLISACIGKPKRIVIGGGETKLSLFNQLLSSLSCADVFLADGDDLTCLGASMLAWHGIGNYRSLAETVDRMCHHRLIPKAQMPHKEEMQQRMEKWIHTLDDVKQ